MAENFFAQLRRLTLHMEKSCQDLQQGMRRPTQDDDDSSGILVLRETQNEVKQLKNDLKTTLADVKSCNTDFRTLLCACQQLVKVQQQQMDKTEAHLQQYGFVPQGRNDVKDEIKHDEEDKENIPQPVTTEGNETIEKADVEGNEKMREEVPCCTPDKSSQQSAPTYGDRTPQLSDFGISESTINFLGALNVGVGQNRQPSYRETQQAEQEDGRLKAGPFGSESGVVVTPGIFNGKKAVFDSPCPPVFCTPGVKQIKKQLEEPPKVPKMEEISNGVATTDSPVPPILKTPGIKQIKKNIYQLEKPNEVPKFQDFSDTTCTIEPMPDLDVTTAVETTIKFETNPIIFNPGQMSNLTEIAQDSISCEPKAPILSGNHKTEKPDSPEPPTLTKPTHPMPKTPVALLQKNMVFESPKPPTLSGTYDFMRPETSEEVGAGIQSDGSELSVVPPSDTYSGQEEDVAFKSMTYVTEEEYLAQASYLQRLLSLDLINSSVDKINQVLKRKIQDGKLPRVSLSELRDDLQMGQKTKSLLLLFVKLQRFKLCGTHVDVEDTEYEVR